MTLSEFLDNVKAAGGTVTFKSAGVLVEIQGRKIFAPTWEELESAMNLDIRGFELCDQFVRVKNGHNICHYTLWPKALETLNVTVREVSKYDLRFNGAWYVQGKSGQFRLASDAVDRAEEKITQPVLEALGFKPRMARNDGVYIDIVMDDGVYVNGTRIVKQPPCLSTYVLFLNAIMKGG